jgi:hypothetical protein
MVKRRGAKGDTPGYRDYLRRTKPSLDRRLEDKQKLLPKPTRTNIFTYHLRLGLTDSKYFSADKNDLKNIKTFKFHPKARNRSPDKIFSTGKIKQYLYKVGWSDPGNSGSIVVAKMSFLENGKTKFLIATMTKDHFNQVNPKIPAMEYIGP